MEYTLEDIRNGQVFLIDKPLGWTSFDAVNKIRNIISKAYKTKKIRVGHAGTLDPLATGLLIVCCGRQTKNIDSYTALQKEYEATINLGATTPSYDLETEPENFKPCDSITAELIAKTIADNFTGKIMQLPPMFSAVSVGGQRLYRAAREGKEINRPAREVTIDEFEVLGFATPELKARIKCSKGTYIRSLANDLGGALGCGAYLSGLRRTRSGDYRVDDAMTIEQFVENFKPED